MIWPNPLDLAPDAVSATPLGLEPRLVPAGAPPGTATASVAGSIAVAWRLGAMLRLDAPKASAPPRQSTRPSALAAVTAAAWRVLRRL